MGFIACALIIDFLTNNKDSNDGAGIIGSLAILGYVLIKLDSIKEYILRVCAGKEQVLMFLIISFTILIPTYWSVMNNKNSSFFVGILLRVMIYIDIFAGLGIMLLIAEKMGMPIVSYVCNINNIELLANSKAFFSSLFGSVFFLIVRLFDIVLTIGLVPIIQFIIYQAIRKIKLNFK